MNPPSISRRSFLAGAVGVGALGIGASVLKRGPDSVATHADSPDWPLVNHDTRNTGYNPRASGPANDPRVRWRTRRFDADYPVGGYLLQPTPVVVGDQVFVGGDELSALRVADGTERWSVTGDDDETFNGTAFADGRIYVTTSRNDAPGIAVFDATGERGWARELPVRYAHPPTVVGETVYVPTYDSLLALDRSSGRRRWQFGNTSFVSAQPAATDDALYAAIGMQGLFARERRQDLLAVLSNGPPDVRWQYEPGQRAYPSPAVGDDHVFVPETQEWHPEPIEEEARLTAFTLDGEQRWDEQGGTSGTSPVVADGTVFYKCSINTEKVDMGEYVTRRSDAKVTAHDASDGTARWRRTFENLGGWQISPVSDGDRLYVPLYDNVDEKPILIASDAATGETQWRFDLDAPAYHLALAGETLYVTTDDGHLYAFE